MIIAGHDVITGVITQSTLLPILRQSGASHSQIARAFGVTQPCVSQWLSGKRTPPSMAVKLAGYVLSQPREIGVGLPTISGGFAGNRRDKPIYDGPKRKRGRPKLSK